MSYKLIKEYNQLKLNVFDDFITRMDFDTFVRHTKEERMKFLLLKNKPKISESDKIETFNRLIEDSNRRQEANGRIYLENLNNTSIKNKKKYNNEEWSNIYKNR